MKIFSIVDYFIAPSLQSNQSLLYKSRMLVGAILATFSFIIFSTPIYLLLPNATKTTVAFFCCVIPTVIAWSTALMLLKKTGAFIAASIFIIISMIILLLSSIAITGGPFDSPVTLILAVPIILSFLLLGKNQGMIWSAGIGASIMGMCLLSLYGFEYWQFMAAHIIKPLNMFILFYTLTNISALIVLYEYISEKVTEQRDKERVRLRNIAEIAVKNSLTNNKTDILTSTGQQLLDSVLQQKSFVEQLSATTEELRASAEKNMAIANQNKLAINTSKEQISASKLSISELTNAINSLEASSKEIQKINNVIDDIAYQTNLLSLNAMIEASRSDAEESSGFKVVALEVKKLAERSTSAAANINDLLKKNFSMVKLGVERSKNINEQFNAIEEGIKPLEQSITQVVNASIEQNEAVQQIGQGLVSINQYADENKSLSQSLNENARNFNQSTEELMSSVSTLALDIDTEKN